MNKKIAFPSNDRNNVEEHFGHCKEFVIYNIKNGEVASIEHIIPPAHVPGSLPKFLSELNATTIITGGMGAMAINLFKENNIEVILGANGLILDNLKSYLDNDLISTGAACAHDHGHSDNCSH